jgi:hypothetical protein
MRMWLKDTAPPSPELNPLPAPAVNDESKAAMEMLRDQLNARAAAVLAAGPDPATGAKGANTGIEKNRLPKASDKLGRWLREKMEKKDRFPKRLWAGLRKPVDLYDRLRRFAEEIGKAGEQINASQAVLVAQRNALSARIDALEHSLGARVGRCEMDYPSLIAAQSQQIAELRRQVEELQKNES